MKNYDYEHVEGYLDKKYFSLDILDHDRAILYKDKNFTQKQRYIYLLKIEQ